jgi:hypothetical protein
MRKVVAKRLRAEARVIARNSPTEYGLLRKVLSYKDGKKIVPEWGTIVARGYRRVYQDLKRDFYAIH